jgi:MinD-like ATPase involved in chromosome partitioning or flagellar assembly
MGVRRASRWLVCSGALEFAGVSAALAMGACAAWVQWSPSSDEVRETLRFCVQDGSTNVLVAGGLAGEDPCEAACALAGLHAGRTILCVPDAAAVSPRCAQRGVTATVEPQGLVRLLCALRAEELASAPEGDAVDGGEMGQGGPAREVEKGAPGREEEPGGTASDESLAGGVLDNPQAESPTQDAPAAQTAVMPATRQVRSQGGVPLQDCDAQQEAPFDLDAIKEPVVLTPVVHLSQELECRVAGMDKHVPTVCVASARGGVGKSALAVLAALSLAKRGLSVALIDLDFQFGTCLGYLGSGETDGLIDAGLAPKSVRVDARTLARCRTTPQRGLAAYEFCRMPEQAELLFGVADELIRAARAGFDVAVVDLPAGVNETVAQAIELADRCLFVADQGALSLESLSAQQSLCARLGIPRTKLVTVMNRCDPRHRDEGFLSRVGFETQAPQVARVLDGGSEVTQMLSIGRASELLGIQNKFATSVDALMVQVCTGLGIGGFTDDELAGPAASAANKAGKPFWRRDRAQDKEEQPCPF